MESAWNWTGLVAKIFAEDPDSLEELYAVLAGPVRGVLARHLPPDSCEDGLHEILLIVIHAIRARELRDPDRLMGFVNTVARRHAVAFIRRNISERRRFTEDFEPRQCSAPTPEELVLHRERVDSLRAILRGLQARDREILDRFYLRGQNAAEICSEMRLTSTQFRLYKSRALARCARLSVH